MSACSDYKKALARKYGVSASLPLDQFRQAVYEIAEQKQRSIAKARNYTIAEPTTPEEVESLLQELVDKTALAALEQ